MVVYLQLLLLSLSCAASWYRLPGLVIVSVIHV